MRGKGMPIGSCSASDREGAYETGVSGTCKRVGSKGVAVEGGQVRGEPLHEVKCST